MQSDRAPISVTAENGRLARKPSWYNLKKPETCFSRKGSIKGFQSFLEKNKEQNLESVIDRSSAKCNLHCFKVNNENSIIVHLPCNTSITLCGYLKVTIIYGHLFIFGYNLYKHSRNKSVVIFGSKDLLTFLVEAKLHNEKDYSGLKELPLPELNIATLLSNIQSNDTVILIEEVALPTIFLAKKYIKPYIFPIVGSTPVDIPESRKWLNCAINFKKTIPTYVEAPEWQSMQLLARTLVIGGEGTGKSTIAKYIINRLLNSHRAVIFLELDIGQGEFTPPGCVALIIIRQPIFGPNFTHLIEPERMIHLGDVDVSKCSTKYLESVEMLAQDLASNSNYSEMPLVVNTMGFCKGLGLHLAIKTITILKPTTVVQLNSNISKKNFENHLTPEIVCNKSFVYCFHLIPSVSTGFKRAGTKREARERMLLSYFSPLLLPPYFSLNAVQPYFVSFSDVSIGIISNIAAKDVLSALNGCIVGLCEKPVAEGRVLKSDVPNWFSIMLEPPVLNCLGLGIVRGIDVDKRLFYLLTPIDNSKLQRVELLQMSHVEVPSVVFINQDGVEGSVPYVMQTKHDLPLVSVKRTFHHRRHNQTPFMDTE